MAKVFEGFSMIFQGLLGIIGALWWVWAIVFGLCVLVRGCMFIRVLIARHDDGASFYQMVFVWMWLKPILIFSLVLLLIAGAVHFG